MRQLDLCLILQGPDRLSLCQPPHRVLVQCLPYLKIFVLLDWAKYNPWQMQNLYHSHRPRMRKVHGYLELSQEHRLNQD